MRSVCGTIRLAAMLAWIYKGDAEPLRLHACNMGSGAAVQVINSAAKTWGLECLRYEIRDILPPPGIVRAMELQAEAERRKRAQVLESEGVRQATINESEARRVRHHAAHPMCMWALPVPQQHAHTALKDAVMSAAMLAGVSHQQCDW
jgi:SPFH domain / Band 7 family